MNDLIEALTSTLARTKYILNTLTDEQLTNSSISPYYSCIGTHIRHVLDFYRCIDQGLESNEVDLTARNRNSEIERSCAAAIQELDSVLERLENWRHDEPDRRIMVIDDLGNGKQHIEYTFASLAAQANSHTIHHYALINYMMDKIGVRLDDLSFGYNPSTPKPGEINLAG